MRALLFRLIDATDPGASLRHFCFLVVVVATIVWLSITISRPLSSSWIEAFGLLLASVTGAKIFAKDPATSSTAGKDATK